MFILLFIVFRLHLNHRINDQTIETTKPEKINNPNLQNSRNYLQSTRKKIESMNKCDILKYSIPTKIILQETGDDAEIFLECDNMAYHPHHNNVDLEKVIIKFNKKHPIDDIPEAIIFINNADFSTISTTIESQITLNSDAQLIRFSGLGNHIINDTSFKLTGTIGEPKLGKKTQSLLSMTDPTLVVFGGYSSNFILSSQFYEPQNRNEQETQFYPVRCIRTRENVGIKVTSTTFHDGISYHLGSFIHHSSTGNISIVQCKFEQCEDKEKKAHGIYVKNMHSEIKDSEFKNILNEEIDEGSVILIDSANFNFVNNLIQFERTIFSIDFLRTQESEQIDITNNDFQNIGLELEGRFIFMEKTSSILFNYNKFSNIKCNQNEKGIYLRINNLNDTPLVGNEFYNVTLSNSLIHILAEGEIDNIRINNWEYHYINQNGTGILEFDNPNNKSYILILTNCSFLYNTNTDGGALLINEELLPQCVGLHLINCLWSSNSASGKGGALAYFNDGNITIENCNFSLNSASDGGAIYIENSFTTERTIILANTYFNEDNGRESHAIWVNCLSFDDDLSLEISQCNFSNCYGLNYKGGASCLCNCKATKVINCYFQNLNDGNHNEMQCGGINMTAKGELEVDKCYFIRCSAGSIEGSYGGGIGYSYRQTDELDQNREEHILIQLCEFDNIIGNNGVALYLNLLSTNVSISQVQVKNHFETGYIFFIQFNSELDDIFVLDNIKFIGNRYMNRENYGDCGGSGIWICESKTQDYIESLAVKFQNCSFEYNSSPTNGGAFAYNSIDRLESVELIFDGCFFNHNYCQKLGGACHFGTKKTVEMYNCEFRNNSCLSDQSGGGALAFQSSVGLTTINNCIFSNCIASKGSFFYTQGGIRGINISDCTLGSLDEKHFSSVHIDVDQLSETFVFERNHFTNFACFGDYGGTGLHIGTDCECEITSCTFIGNKGESQIIIPESSNEKLIFSKCKFKQDGGSRIMYIKSEASVDFNSCEFVEFDTQVSDTGRGLIVYSISREKASTFYNCIFSNIKSYSVIDLENAKTITIDGCRFTNVEACIRNEGGILIISKATSFSLTNCILSESGSPDGVDHSCFELCPTIDKAEVINCTFIKCGRCAKGAAIKAPNVSNIEIIGSKFLENFAQGVSGNTLSVYIGGSYCMIVGCKVFTRKVAINQYDQFQFRIFSSQVIILDNLFDKLNPSDVSTNEPSSYGGIYFSGISNLEIHSNVFKTRNTAVYIDKSSQINVINNIWEECYGKKGIGPRAFYIHSTQDTILFINNTVRNCPDVDNHIMTFSSQNIIIENCDFYGNTYISGTGGGIGIQFECSDFKSTFTNCTFRNNQGNIGGGIQFGGCNSLETSNTGTFEMFRCIFIENNAKLTGGGLSFTTQKQNIIENCTFLKNIGYNRGGAISIISQDIDSTYKTSNEGASNNVIKNCRFEDNTGNNGCQCISIMNKGSTLIENCYFSNFNIPAGMGGQILTQRQAGWKDDEGLIEVMNAYFDSTESSSCNSIFIRDFGLSIIHNCTFSNNKQDSLGNAIVLNMNGALNEVYDNIFYNCGKGGYVVYCSGIGLDIHHNEFKFTDIDNSCGCIKIIDKLESSINHKIYNNHFHNSKVDYHNKGTLYYYCSASGILVISDNIFDNLKGDSASFHIEYNNNIELIFENNSIQNNRPGDYKFLCEFINQEDGNRSTRIRNNKFINNTCNSLYGGGIGFWTAIDILEFIDCLFENNYAVYLPDPISGFHPNGKGGAIQIGTSLSTKNNRLTLTNCEFKLNQADIEGGALSIDTTKEVLIKNCTFYKNIVGLNQSTDKEWYSILGGAISLNLRSQCQIHNCSFIENCANYYSIASSHLTSKDNKEIKESVLKSFGGALFISKDYQGNYISIRIEESIFKSNQAYSGYAIYIFYINNETMINIQDNKFINNFDKDTVHLNSSIIESVPCLNSGEGVILNNFYSNEINGEKIKVKKFSCFDETLLHTSVFSKTTEFTETALLPTLKFSESNLFSDTNIFSASKTMIPIPEQTRTSNHDNRITISKSLSLTYVNRKSVSFSLSYFSTFTYSVGYDEEAQTFTMVLSEMNSYGYFPYIIYILSPLYIERNVTITLPKKNKLSAEKLIGISCGAASAFFLILGIIILSIQRRHEVQNEIDEFYDISESSEMNYNEPLIEETCDFTSTDISSVSEIYI